MAIMYTKGQNYSILKETFKIQATHLENLKNLGVILKVGDTGLCLDNGKGLVKNHSFNTLASNIVKNPQAKDIIEVSAFVSGYLVLANQANAQAVVGSPKKPFDYNSNPYGDITPEADIYGTPLKTKQKASAPVSQTDVDNMPIVKLRDAVALYQRVHGTSGGSIYRVVALNDKLKVAARIKSNAVSIRIEGVLDSESVKSFATLGIVKHSDEYMSGHFSCEKCTPQKLIGSILVGSGVYFTSPLPVISDKVFS